MNDDASWGLLMAFDNDEPAFRRGFEIGRLWALLEERAGDEVAETVHADTAEMLIRLGEALGREYRAEVRDDVWIDVTFAPPGVVL